MFSVPRTLFFVVVLVVVGAPRCYLRVLAAQSNQGAIMHIPDKIATNEMPFAPEDRNIDFLGANIHSTVDAQTYIEAILKRRYPQVDLSSVPGLPVLERRLASAEYAALTDPSERIPEARIVEAFNQLMNEWGTPKWTRITVEDFHRFHKIKAATLIPYSVSRDADGTVANTCRPVEAVYLLEVLSIERGLQYGEELPDLPEGTVKGPSRVDANYSWRSAKQTDKQRVVFRNNIEYLKTRNAWLQSHFDPNPAHQIDQLFDVLHIT